MGQRIMTLSGDLFPHFFRGEKRYRVTRDELPEDTRIVNFQLAFRATQCPQDLVFKLESAEWDDVPDGERIPEITPTFEAL